MLDDSGVVGGEGLGEFVLLALLEEVEVQGLLDALLAFDTEELLGLVRVGGNPGARHPGLALEVPVLGIQVKDLVVYCL